MTLPFTPSEFGRPFTMVTAAEAADIVTVALHGPWVYQHQHPAAERRDEAQKAQEQALLDMYGLLHDGDLIAYVEDSRSHRFLRVPTAYYLEDGWAFSRCFSLSKLQTEDIPHHLEEQPLLFLRSELDEWVASQARRATAKRGPQAEIRCRGLHYRRRSDARASGRLYRWRVRSTGAAPPDAAMVRGQLGRRARRVLGERSSRQGRAGLRGKVIEPR